MRTSAFRVRYAQRGGFYSSRVNLAAFLFFRLRSIRDSVTALRRVMSGWSATRQLLNGNCRDTPRKSDNERVGDLRSSNIGEAPLLRQLRCAGMCLSLCPQKSKF